jgi:hypothetical protein
MSQLLISKGGTAAKKNVAGDNEPGWLKQPPRVPSATRCGLAHSQASYQFLRALCDPQSALGGAGSSVESESGWRSECFSSGFSRL